MSLDREWMYRRYLQNGALNPDFLNGLNSFIEFSCNQPSFMSVDKIKCPCRKCKNIPFQTPSTVRLHVAKKGFVHNYRVWIYQGEQQVHPDTEQNLGGHDGMNTYQNMVMDAAGPHININVDDHTEEAPNPEA